jgi:hypothetical protein
MQYLMKTSPKQISLFTEDELTSSQVDSPASPTQWQASDLEKTMSDTSGQRCLERFEKFSRHGLWAKTFSALLIGQEGWYSTRCRLTWKLKGTKYNRMYFQLVPSTHRTEETEFGLLLKTPSAMDSYSENLTKKEQKFGNSGTLAQEVQSGFIYQRGLLPTPTAIQREHPERVQALKETGVTSMFSRANGEARPNSIIDHLQFHGMLPTPTAMDSTNATATMKSSQVKEGSMHSVTLCRAMAMGMLPTPRAQEIENSKQRIKENRIDSITTMAKLGMLPTPQAADGGKLGGNENQDSLTKRARLETGTTSQLNPQFVMEMMGFPPDWTELPFLNGETSQSKQEATQ